MTTSRSFSCIAAWSRSKPAATPRRHTVTSPKATATRSGWKRTGDAAEGPRRGHHRGPRRRSRAGELPHLRPDPRLHHHQRGLHDMTPISELTDRTRRAQDKARVLNEALPWLTRWAGRTIVVKFGGNVGADTEEALTAAFCSDVALLRRVGLNVVVVHGGGPQISALAERLGHVSRFVDGLRVTDAAMLDIVRMVLLGQVNPQLAGMIGAAGAAAVGVAGTDAGLVTAAARDPRLGFVGDVLAVDPAILLTLLSDGVVPVVATVARGVDPDGRAQDFNVNADTVAGAIAVALGADKLIFLSNVPGLYEEFGTADSSLLSEVDAGRLQGMLDRGELHTGMVPKVRSLSLIHI